MRTLGRHRLKARLTVIAAALLAACGGGHHHSDAAGSVASPPVAGDSLPPAVVQALERARAATARFESLDAAVAAGYQRDAGGCLAHEPLGTMGFHHPNGALYDGRLDVERPEILVYERLPDGRYRLNGVEYIVPYSARSRDATPPRIMGQPLKRADRLEIWYLHVWIWQENPSGMFADWNPTVHCPAGS
jgi:hypothetical protein